MTLTAYMIVAAIVAITAAIVVGALFTDALWDEWETSLITGLIGGLAGLAWPITVPLAAAVAIICALGHSVKRASRRLHLWFVAHKIAGHPSSH